MHLIPCLTHAFQVFAIRSTYGRDNSAKTMLCGQIVREYSVGGFCTVQEDDGDDDDDDDDDENTLLNVFFSKDFVIVILFKA